MFTKTKTYFFLIFVFITFISAKDQTENYYDVGKVSNFNFGENSRKSDIDFLQADSVNTTAIQYLKWETKLITNENYFNPYRVVLSVEYFNEDSSIIYSSYGFWDGDSTYKIRTFFPAPGKWFWKTTYSNAYDKGLHDKSGSVLVEAYSGENSIFKHGPLKVSENGKYLTYGDGKPFFWMGGTAWGLPVSATFEEWKQYIDDRKSKNFNVIQVAPARAHGGIWVDPPYKYPVNWKGDTCFFSDDKWNPAYWQEFDKFIEYANSNGMIVLIVGPAEPYRDDFELEYAELFARNFSARMEGYQVILSPSFDNWHDYQRNNLDSIGTLLSYTRHLISQHVGHSYTGGTINENAEYFRNKNYMDFSINQSGHNGGNLIKCYYKAKAWNLNLLNTPPVKKVLVNTESLYSAGKYASQITINSSTGTDKAARQLGWLSVLSGSSGYSYGAQGIWNLGEPTDSNINLTIPLDSALAFVSSTQMKYLVEFFDSLAWWELEPLHDAVISNETDELKKMVFAISENKNFGVAYLPDNDSIIIDMSIFTNKVSAFWFNPVTGIFSEGTQNIDSLGYHTFVPPIPGEWVLLLKKTQNISQDIWRETLTISDNNSFTKVLTFGLNSKATDSLDVNLGEIALPPIPPYGEFDVRFLLPDYSGSLTDFRNDSNEEISWTIRVQPSNNGIPLTIKWNNNNLPFGSFFLKDGTDGTTIDVDMKEDSIAILSDYSIDKIKIIYKNEYTSKIKYYKGWNLLSVPFKTDTTQLHNLFTGRETPFFEFNEKYMETDSIQTGKGYWVKYSASDTLTIYGKSLKDTVFVEKGWNLIGVVNEGVKLTNIQTEPPNIIDINIYGYDKGYFIADSLETGKGYWMFAKQAGKVLFNETPLNKKNNLQTLSSEPQIIFNIIASDGVNEPVKLTFGLDSSATDSPDAEFGETELPPLPPFNTFDIRIVLKDTIATSYSDIRNFESDCNEHSIKYQLSDSSNGLLLKWNLPNGVMFNISNNNNDPIFNASFIDGPDSIIISDTTINTLKFTFCYSAVLLSQGQTNKIRNEFKLYQNFPNPFGDRSALNKSVTKIKYSIPKTEFVSVKIYNILGELVATLVEKRQNSGFYTIEFNAQSVTGRLPSGIYFYRLQSGNNIQTRKMILLR